MARYTGPRTKKARAFAILQKTFSVTVNKQLR